MSSNIVHNQPIDNLRGWKKLHSTIKHHYDAVYIHKIRDLESLYVKAAQRSSNVKFLRKCKKLTLVPHCVELRTLSQDFGTSDRMKRLHSKIQRMYLKEVIIQNYQELHAINMQIQKDRTYIRSHLPDLWIWIAHLLNRSFNRKLEQCKNVHLKKIDDLLKDKIENSLTCIPLPPDSPNPKTVLDLCNPSKLSENEKRLLSLGLNYALPYQDIPDQLIKTMISIEAKMNNMDIKEPMKDYVRNGTMKIIDHDWKPNKARVKWETWINEALKLILRRTDIKIGKADKNNCVVIMDREEYENKMNKMLSEGPYTVLSYDPTKQDMQKLSGILEDLKQKDKITEDIAISLTQKQPRCPPIYGSLKTHKLGIPFRPIVDFRTAASYKVAVFTSRILKHLTTDHEYAVNNSTDFIHDLQDKQLKRGYKKVSFDVVSLFTNVPIQPGLEAVKELLEENPKWKSKTKLDITELMILVKFCVTSTSFCYNNIIYHQDEGTAMGSPISPVFVEIFMQKMEMTIVQHIPSINFYRRYVDDIYAHIHERKCLEILEKLNGYHPSLQFTMEEENETTNLPFLDVMLYTRDDSTIGHYVYRKPTFVNTYLLYTSYHPNAHKLGVVDTLLTRALRLCDSDHLQSEINAITAMLRERKYPDKLISKRLTLVKEKEIRRNNMSKEELKVLKEEIEMTPRIILPFFGKTTEKIARFLRFALNVEIGYYPGLKIGSIVCNLKDKPEKLLVGIYELLCDATTCKENVYIGETGIGIEERFSQHQADVRNNNLKSAVARHMTNTGHQICGIKLIEYEPREWKRKLKEGLYIRAISDNMNASYGKRIPAIWSSGLTKFF